MLALRVVVLYVKNLSARSRGSTTTRSRIAYAESPRPVPKSTESVVESVVLNRCKKLFFGKAARLLLVVVAPPHQPPKSVETSTVRSNLLVASGGGGAAGGGASGAEGSDAGPWTTVGLASGGGHDGGGILSGADV